MQGLVETGNVKEALSYVNFKVLSGNWVEYHTPYRGQVNGFVS